CGVGLISFLLLQSTFRAGSLVASQPALTLGDALVSVALGWVLFGERIVLGPRVVPETVGACLIAAGAAGLTRSPAVAGGGDAAAAPAASAAPATSAAGAASAATSAVDVRRWKRTTPGPQRRDPGGAAPGAVAGGDPGGDPSSDPSGDRGNRDSGPA